MRALSANDETFHFEPPIHGRITAFEIMPESATASTSTKAALVEKLPRMAMMTSGSLPYLIGRPNRTVVGSLQPGRKTLAATAMRMSDAAHAVTDRGHAAGVREGLAMAVNAGVTLTAEDTLSGDYVDGFQTALRLKTAAVQALGESGEDPDHA